MRGPIPFRTGPLLDTSAPKVGARIQVRGY
jgi:hypothetical protein